MLYMSSQRAMLYKNCSSAGALPASARLGGARLLPRRGPITAARQGRAATLSVRAFKGETASLGQQQPGNQQAWPRNHRPEEPQAISKYNTMAIILGGGPNSDRRLFPLTIHRALPAIPVLGNYRLVDIPISSALQSGVTKVYVATHYQSQSLNKHVNDSYNFGGAPLANGAFVEIYANSQQPGNYRWALGGADAVRMLSNMIKEHRNVQVEHVLVLPATQLYYINFEEVVREHRRTHADLTIVGTLVGTDQARRMGLLKVAGQVDGRGGTLIDYAEKPRTETQMAPFELPQAMGHAPRSTTGTTQYMASTGIMIFRKEVLVEVLERYPLAQSFGAEVLPAMLEDRATEGKLEGSARRYKICVFQAGPNKWADASGSIGSFLKANLEVGCNEDDHLFGERLWGDKMVCAGARPPMLMGHVPLLPSSMVGCKLRRTVVSPGCQLTGVTAHNCIIGPRSIIGEGTTIRDSYIMGADYYESEKPPAPRPAGFPAMPAMGIGRRCEIARAIIDKNARIGDDCVLVNTEGIIESSDRLSQGIVVRDGVIVVPKSSVLHNGTRV